MNKKKKIQDLYNKRRKRARAKLDGRPKERYISKADRAKAEADAEKLAAESDVEQSGNDGGDDKLKDASD